MSTFLPQIKIIKNENTEFHLEIDNFHFTFLNSLRRIILSEIPTMAFEEIYFENNSSTMNEEMISHRIGMIPLCCRNIDDFILSKECQCMNGCPQCESNFSIHVENQEKEKIGVFSQDLQKITIDENISVLEYDDNQNGILILELNPKENIKLMAKARKGYGKTHAKWSSVISCTFEKQEETQNFLFKLETNPNVFAIDVFQQSLQRMETQYIELRNKIQKFETNHDTYVVPYCDSILNPLIQHISDNFDVPVCFYKRGHFLKEKTSEIFLYEGENQPTLGKELIIKSSINIILSKICLLEQELNKSYHGIYLGQ